MRDRQMELNLTNGRGCRSANLRSRRRSRSQRWFELMREAVESGSEQRSVSADSSGTVERFKLEAN
jgi:hypothetical protein